LRTFFITTPDYDLEAVANLKYQDFGLCKSDWKPKLKTPKKKYPKAEEEP